MQPRAFVKVCVGAWVQVCARRRTWCCSGDSCGGGGGDGGGRVVGGGGDGVNLRCESVGNGGERAAEREGGGGADTESHAPRARLSRRRDRVHVPRRGRPHGRDRRHRQSELPRPQHGVGPHYHGHGLGRHRRLCRLCDARAARQATGRRCGDVELHNPRDPHDGARTAQELGVHGAAASCPRGHASARGGTACGGAAGGSCRGTLHGTFDSVSTAGSRRVPQCDWCARGVCARTGPTGRLVAGRFVP